MSQYFDQKPDVASRTRELTYEIKGQKLSFISDNGVFSKTQIDVGTSILLDVIVPMPLSGRLLDLGCGYGVIGITLATFNKNLKVVCADVNERAVSLTRTNASRLNVASQVEAIQSNVFSNVKGQFETIVINPPIRAGKKITYAMYDGAYQSLIDGGSMFIVIRKAQGAPSALEYLESVFSSVNVINKSKGYWIIQAIKTKK